MGLRQTDLTYIPYEKVMKAKLTSKGQITIPLKVRRRLGLKPGSILEFDENAPFLQARKVVDERAWADFGKNAANPWPGASSMEIVDQIRGPVDLPPGSGK